MITPNFISEPLEGGWSTKGLTINWYMPLGIVKVVFTLSSRSNGTCQYPFVRSSTLRSQAADVFHQHLSSRYGIGVKLGNFVDLAETNSKS